MKDGFSIRIGRDEFTPAVRQIQRNATGFRRKHILSVIANDLVNEIRDNIESERQYDGKPMKSPAKRTKCNGRFAASYKWRYLKSYRYAKSGESRRQTVTRGPTGGRKVRGREPVTCASKQLYHTGGFIKGIGTIAVNANKAIVGGRTGHSRAILSYHGSTRRPAGYSKEFAQKSAEKAMSMLMKGV